MQTRKRRASLVLATLSSLVFPALVAAISVSSAISNSLPPTRGLMGFEEEANVETVYISTEIVLTAEYGTSTSLLTVEALSEAVVTVTSMSSVSSSSSTSSIPGDTTSTALDVKTFTQTRVTTVTVIVSAISSTIIQQETLTSAVTTETESRSASFTSSQLSSTTTSTSTTTLATSTLTRSASTSLGSSASRLTTTITTVASQIPDPDLPGYCYDPSRQVLMPCSDDWTTTKTDTVTAAVATNSATATSGARRGVSFPNIMGEADWVSRLALLLLLAALSGVMLVAG